MESRGLCAPFWNCYFLHLPSYHLPCLPARARAAAQPARAAVFFCLFLGILHENTFFALAKMSSLWVAQPVESEYNTGRAGFPAEPSAPAGRVPAPPGAGRGFHRPPAFQKINRVRLCALSAASTGSCAADEGEVFPRCTACIPLLHGLGRGPRLWPWPSVNAAGFHGPPLCGFIAWGGPFSVLLILDSEKEALP